MREIKFRVWIEKGKRMLYDSSLAIKGNQIIEEIGTKVMQFTGLKDKNDKEIYEGDIVETRYGKGKITYDETNACFTPNVAAMDFEAWDIDYLEVIGNIYENPELIK